MHSLLRELARSLAIKGVPSRPMDDATLNPQPDASQGPTGRTLQRIVRAARAPQLGRAGGRAAAARRRDHQPQLPRPLRRHRLRDPAFPARTPRCSRSTARRERVANERAAAVGIAPPVAAMLDDPPGARHRVRRGRGMSAEDLREPAALAEVARCAAGDPRARRAAADRVRLASGSSRPTPRPRRGRGGDAARRLRRGARPRRARSRRR